jgi:hypothetical protein
MRREIVASGLAGVAILVFVTATVVDPAGGSNVLWFPVVALFVPIGALLWTRVPANPIGPLFLVAGTMLVIAVAAGMYADLGQQQVQPWPGSDLARAVANAAFFYAIVIALIGIPLVFPDGRLPSPRFRWVVGVAVLDMIAWTLGVTFGSLLAPIVEPTVFISTIVGFCGAAVALWVRFRRGGPVQRQQVKWLMANGALAAIFFPIAFALPDPATSPNPALAYSMWAAAILTLLLLPVVIGIAILRYRLYEIDRIVSRTIAYATVTGVLAAVFGGIVVVLSTLLAQVAQGQQIAVAASTLAVFAVFQPVLRRVRRTVDRRFNRARYDAQGTIDTFSGRLRDEVDLSMVREALIMTVTEAVDPLGTSVWLRSQHEGR